MNNVRVVVDNGKGLLGNRGSSHGKEWNKSVKYFRPRTNNDFSIFLFILIL